ncbi:MAG: hypothetical protein ACD_73C00253G0002 [uncultured bacterium]|nr:MAG: hypothetical protein ACD_73C00253G0002 [uncultured bacterium]
MLLDLQHLIDNNYQKGKPVHMERASRWVVFQAVAGRLAKLHMAWEPGYLKCHQKKYLAERSENQDQQNVAQVQ